MGSNLIFFISISAIICYPVSYTHLLFGDANPGGKLAESWPLRYSDCVCAPYYGERDPLYREGLYVGYRHYASAGIPLSLIHI